MKTAGQFRKDKTRQIRLRLDEAELNGSLAVPEGAAGVVLFAHGSGSSRLSPRNTYVAEALQRAGIGTLLFDLLTEEEARDRANVFDIDFLAHRLSGATRWLRAREGAEKYAIGYFGASTGAAAALISAAHDHSICAVVSRGGRPDLAYRLLGQVEAPTLLIVGGEDTDVIAMNASAYGELKCEKAFEIVPRASHLFEEPGALDEVVRLASNWFRRHLTAKEANPPYLLSPDPTFADRTHAGRMLAARLMKFKTRNPVVLAIPRGGVPVALEIALELNAPLDVMVVRKLGAPGQPELGIGALVDGDHPETFLNSGMISALSVPKDYLEREVDAQLREILRRQRLYRGGRPRVELEGRTVIVVDDGIATGGSVRAALRGIRRANPAAVVLAVPVAPADTVEALAREADEVVCLIAPATFFGISQFYEDFHQLSDQEVIRMLASGRAEQPAEIP